MATKNEHTGDSLISKINTKEYEDNYDKIFGKKKTPPVEDGYEQEERLERIAKEN
jgi:hypothetical protein